MNIDYQKIDMLIRYIIAVAGQEYGWDRELGPIHIIKYVYLVDLAYAEHHDGETYTGLKWQFYHYGPWSLDLYQRIETALNIPQIEKKEIQSQYDRDFVRWQTNDPYLFEDLDDQMGLIISMTVQNCFKRFTNNTYELLHYVYLTKPMLNAAPNEYLDFHIVSQDPERSQPKEKSAPSRRQEKKQKVAVDELRKKIEERLSKKKIDKKRRVKIKPRYDKVFFNGVDWLNFMAKADVEPTKGVMKFSDGIWKSDARKNSDNL